MIQTKLYIGKMRRTAYFVLRLLKKYAFNNDFKKQSIYTKYRENKPINDKLIFYEAYHGQSMTGNPFAVFKYLIERPEYQKYHHVWAIKDKSAIQEEFNNRTNVTFVKYHSKDYVKYLSEAKYLINDTTFPSFFHKRREQIYANIWHGTPLKTMGLDIKNRGFTDHKNIQRNFLFTDFMVCPNIFTAEKLLKSHDVHGIYSGNVLEIGYPRVDLMHSVNTSELRKKLAIPDGKKVILYAPTWRGILGKEDNYSQKLLKDIQSIQKNINDDFIVLLKSHYYAYKYFKHQKMEKIFISNNLDTNELLSIVDILITDYSSIFFEFLPTNRPIIFYAYDVDEYQKNRGTYIDMNNLPGPICTTIDEVISNINNIGAIKEKYHNTYNSFKKRFCYHDDGHATERFINAFIHGKTSNHIYHTRNDKIKILMYGGGFLNNGITASVTNLLNAINYDKYDVTLIDYGNTDKEEKWNNINKLNRNVRYLYKAGSWNATITELIRHALVLRKGVYTDTMKRIIPTTLYKREIERITGSTQFDIGIDFSGYSPLWSSLIAFGDFKRKSIFLHADMGKEIQKKVVNRYPHRINLNVIFSLYNFFDKVLSVSPLTHQENVKNLSQFINNHGEKMDYVINTIDYNKILLSKDNFHYEFGNDDLLTTKHQQVSYPVPDEKNTNFINIGRLGPEKDHAKLIKAFYKVVDLYPKARLYIVGEGVLKETLFALVEKLNLKDKVVFTGQLSNPYGLLNQCDCFVLSSNHEGQPMVLLEALVLGKPIIVTDIPGSRSVIEGGFGHIVENSIEGLVEGMLHFINGNRLNTNDFDYHTYHENAIQMFYEKVCNIES